MKVFQPRRLQEKSGDNPQNPVDKNAKNPQTPFLAFLSTPSGGLSENISNPQPNPEVVIPEPLEPSPLWLEAITRAAALPLASYVVELFLPEYLDCTDVRFSRDTEGHALADALKALSLRFPMATGVEVAKPKSLEVLLAVGTPIKQRKDVRP